MYQPKRDAIALESDLILFSFNARLTLQLFLWPIVLIGLSGNAAVLARIFIAPTGRFALLKPFYRCALISFALSDLLLLLASGSHVLLKVGHSTTLLWHLPDWACVAVPFLQTLAILAGSLTLASIAIDRYRALIAKYPTSEKPKWFRAACFNIIIWLFAAAASYPIIGLYEHQVFTVVGKDSIYEGHLCITDQRPTALVYTTLFVAIFVPLTLVFLLVHVLLALNIWRRQKQQQQQHHHHQQRANKSRYDDGNNESLSTELSSAVSNSMQQQQQQNQKRAPKKQQHQQQHQQQPGAARALTSSSQQQTRRKKRTVNVILVLIFVFLAGRLPSWTFLLCKQYLRLPGGSLLWHYLQTWLTGLSLLSAALDPFLYAFLCEALSLAGFLRQSCAKIRCQERPPATSAVNAAAPSDRCRSRVGSNGGPAIVPRGPYNF